jgi:hypothetical protein
MSREVGWGSPETARTAKGLIPEWARRAIPRAAYAGLSASLLLQALKPLKILQNAASVFF